ncbi:unnamed protein product [Camellia sinensis]
MPFGRTNLHPKVATGPEDATARMVRKWFASENLMHVELTYSGKQTNETKNRNKRGEKGERKRERLRTRLQDFTMTRETTTTTTNLVFTDERR